MYLYVSATEFNWNPTVRVSLLVATVSELEGMVQDQRQLMEKLTAECKTLTNKLEDATLKHK